MAGVIKMNKWLISVLLVFTSLSVHAEKMAFNVGEIVSINSTVIKFNDQSFLLSPSVKVVTKNNKKTTFSKLKVGDYVVLSMIKIGNKKLVDQIQMSPFGQLKARR